MQPAETPSIDRALEPGPPRVLLLVLVLGAATVAAVVLGGGNVFLALAPCLLALLLGALWTLPLRVPLLALLAISWVAEIAGDSFASGRLHTPLALAGDLLFVKLNDLLPVSALVFSGFDVLLLLLGVILLYRHAVGSGVDRTRWVAAPRVLGQAALLSLAALLCLSLSGLARGGDFRFVLWQVTRHLYLPVIYFFMVEALRGAIDATSVGVILLGAGFFRAVEAMILRQLFPSIEVLPHATTHHDTVLFAVCFAILLALVLERPTRRSLKIVALLLPVYLGGMVANNRRLVWVELGMVAAFFFLLTPRGRAKRVLSRALVLSLLPILLYAAAGWSSGSSLFRPVQTVRSLFDAKVDGSTRWRDFENHDLVFTFKQSPLFGSGFGRPYVEDWILPGELTGVYDLEPYIPHNSVLGLWAFGGLLGFSLLWFIYPVGIFFAVRAYRCARTPTERITALGASGVLICYLMQGYGDLGFGTWGPVFTLAAALALVGKICVANGAWPDPRASRPAARPPSPHPAGGAASVSAQGAG